LLTAMGIMAINRQLTAMGMMTINRNGHGSSEQQWG